MQDRNSEDDDGATKLLPATTALMQVILTTSVGTVFFTLVALCSVGASWLSNFLASNGYPGYLTLLLKFASYAILVADILSFGALLIGSFFKTWRRLREGAE